MGLEEIAKRNQVPAQPRDLQSAAIDAKERIIVLSLELSGRVLGTRSLEDFYFMLTNDIRDPHRI